MSTLSVDPHVATATKSSLCLHIFQPLTLLQWKYLWRHMVTQIWFNIGSGYGLVPGGTNSLSEAMLSNHQWGLEALPTRCPRTGATSTKLSGFMNWRSSYLTHGSREKNYRYFLDDIFKYIFLKWMKMYESGLQFHRSVFLRVQLTVFQR